MSSKNDIIYTAADIRNYLSGNMNPAAMNTLEKAALDDPFLAEAIEGYEGMPAGEWEGTLAELKGSFAKNQSPAKVITMRKTNFRWWKAVAAVLILGCGSYISYSLLQNKEPAGTREIASKITLPVSIDSAKTFYKKEDSTRLSGDLSSTAATITPIGKLELKKVPANNQYFSSVTQPLRGTTNIADSLLVYRPEFKPKPVDIAALKVVTDVDGDLDDKNKELAAVPAPVMNASGQANAYNWNGNGAMNSNSNPVIGRDEIMKDKKMNRKAAVMNQPENYFAAQVFAPDKSPLPFANINIKNEGLGTYADASGRFRLTNPTDTLLTVEVKSLGYKTQVYTLRSNQPLNHIVLEEENSKFKDKIASGLERKIRRPSIMRDSSMLVEPRDGWDKYNTYAVNNLELPQELEEKEIHGEVELSFDIKKNGDISNIKVEKSLCDRCDEAALKLISQGPQWKVISGKKGKGKVKVSF